MVQTKPLGQTGHRLSEIGLGTAQYIGGPLPLRRGIELGAALIDTAESYGTEFQRLRPLPDHLLLLEVQMIIVDSVRGAATAPGVAHLWQSAQGIVKLQAARADGSALVRALAIDPDAEIDAAIVAKLTRTREPAWAAARPD